MDTFNKTKIALVLSVLCGTSYASVNNVEYSWADERFLSSSELAERQDFFAPKGPKTHQSTYIANEYVKDQSLPVVTAYISNWAQYAREFNVDKVAASYDKIVLSFFGLCGTGIGDSDITSAVNSLETICGYTKPTGGLPKTFEVMTTDVHGDFASNAGGAVEPPATWIQESQRVHDWYNGAANGGMFKAMKELKQHNGDDLTIAFSVGGWSLSEPFSRMASNEGDREVFINSAVKVFNNFSFFSQIDIDWEYPGGGGADGNSKSIEDGENYKLLIKELREALDDAGHTDVTIAIAAGAPKDKLDASNLKALVDHGVDTIHLMTYDFFGTPWAESLGHHTNLHSYENSDWSADFSIQYMIEVLDIESSKIHIGYAGYSRNASNADIDSFSPLSGTYSMPNGDKHVGGSYEKGTFEWYDLEQNFLSISESEGLEIGKINANLSEDDDYHLYTDKEANADYIYSEGRNFFISLDTPRTVYSKAKYAKEMNLGGVFMWMGDYDNGYLINSAREGLGYTKTSNSSNIEMHKIIYSCGINVESDAECKSLTELSGSTDLITVAKAGEDITSSYEVNAKYHLDGSGSTSEQGELTYFWKLKEATGLAKENVILKRKKTPSPLFIIEEGAFDGVTNATLKFQLQVTDENGVISKDSVKFTLVNAEDNTAPVSIATPVGDVIHGQTFTLNASQSYDNEQPNNQLTYKWVQIFGESVVLPSDGTGKNLDVDTSTLKNITQQLKFELVVSDGLLEDSDTVKFNVLGNEDSNQSPTTIIQVQGSNRLGEPVSLNGSQSTDDGNIIEYKWSVKKPNGNNQSLDDKYSPVTTFTPTKIGKYKVKLRVTDNFGIRSSETITITVNEDNDNADNNDNSVIHDYVYPDGIGSYTGGTKVKVTGTSNDGVYECNEGVTSNWCTQNNWAYAPGDGLHWDMAWSKLD
ncbi:glycosyl hydrolase family 18 protein [Photobacterium minamisatsumaniensis]|uniref:glycoside hydrolase family 18 protein n=1 Tax=Photobacterium minamisatsumaniensis TaxID=2910233 RepID=UPI003D0D03DA